MQCKRCNSNNTTITYNSYTKSKSRSFIWNLIMLFLTGGLWILWMLIRRKKQKVIREKICVCQDCGYSFKV